MEVFTRKPKKFLEPVDEWLQHEGYYRKHSPRDPTCLFRSVSEQVYQSQSFHEKVRMECLEYMKKHADLFQEKVSIPFDSYLERMSYPNEWGGTIEILAMSQLYGRDVVIFHAQKLSQSKLADQGKGKVLNFAFTPPNQYDTVFTQEYTSKAAFCQSLAYQVLYKGVFKMESVDHTVNKMLHDYRNPLRHEKFFQRANMENRGQLAVQLYTESNKYNPDTEETRLLAQGIAPFPYRVAKALDPNIYRNVDFDVWHEIKRDNRNRGKYNVTGLQPGAQCQILMSAEEANNNNQNVKDKNYNVDNSKSIVPSNQQELLYNGYIQEVDKAQGSALVFIQELGTKKMVPYNSLRILPFQRRMPRGQNNYWVSRPGQRKNLPLTYNNNVKWRRPANNNWNHNYNNRKMKDHEVTSNFNKVQISSNSKSVTKNVSKMEWCSETKVKNRSMHMKEEKFTSVEEYQVTDKSVEDVRTVLESTKISKVSTIEQKVKDKNMLPKNPPKTVNDNALKKRTNVYRKEDFNQEMKKEVAEVKEMTQVLSNQDKIRNDYQTSLPRHDSSSDYRSNSSDFRNNSIKSLENYIPYQYEANDPIQAHQTNIPQLHYPPGLPPAASQYTYPLPYPQLPYCPANVYNAEPETYTAQYYPPSQSFISMTYPNSESNENSPPRPACVPPCQAYPSMENYSHFAPVYPAQYIYQPALYTTPSSTNPSLENYCAPYQGPAYFIPYQPMPPNVTNINPQNTPTM